MRKRLWEVLGIGATGMCGDDARGLSLVPPGEKKKWGGTKMVRVIVDDAGGYGFSGLQD